MNSTDYLEASSRTAATIMHTDKVCPDYALAKLGAYNQAAASLDQIKKALFYGRDGLIGTIGMEHGLRGTLDNINIDLSHGILGMATEAGELTELMEKAMMGEAIADSKILDECGDLLWYMAMVLRLIGKDFDEAMERNINKLKLRFPDKFTTTLANSKDHKAEAAAFKGV